VIQRRSYKKVFSVSHTQTCAKRHLVIITSANKNFFTKTCTSAADPSNCNAVSACSRDKYHV
jgi:hypothetical protein